MAAKKLTKAERYWLDQLEALFRACPSKRLGCYTIGDPSLTFYDKDVEQAWCDANPRVELDASARHQRAGSALDSISTGTVNVDSCAG